VGAKLLHGVSIAFLFSPMYTLIKHHVPDHLYSTAITVLVAIKAVAVTILSISVGYFIEATGSTYSMYTIFMSCTVIGLLVLFYYGKIYNIQTIGKRA
jgi:MFS-type transporter involved in bile tolerance (Atg22 family)